MERSRRRRYASTSGLDAELILRNLYDALDDAAQAAYHVYQDALGDKELLAKAIRREITWDVLVDFDLLTAEEARFLTRYSRENDGVFMSPEDFTGPE